MKKSIFFFLIAIFALSSCSNQYKAEKAVNEYLKTRLNNPASYQSVSFGTLTPCGDEQMNEDIANQVSFGSSLGNSLSSFGHFSDAGMLWSITHTYRGTNSYNAIVTENKTFYLSSDCSSVKAVE